MNKYNPKTTTKNIEDFTIYCTPKQTKVALKLGAPIERRSDNYDPSNRYFRFKLHPSKYGGTGYYYVKCPTTEEMIGWLEAQGEVIKFLVSYYKNDRRIGEKGSPSHKEATLAVIDAALEYLVRKEN